MRYTRGTIRMLGLSLALAILGMAIPSWAQTTGQVAPSSHFTWDELLERERNHPPAGGPATAAPSPGRLRGRSLPAGVASKPVLPPTVNQPVPQLLSLCPGFSAWPHDAQNFQGLGDNNTLIPPDTMGAVGPRHVLTMINSQVQIQNRIGTVSYSTVSLSTFWSGLSGPFDPRVFYDSLSGRWIAVCAGNGTSANSNWAISISQTADPTGSWTAYLLDGDGNNTLWADFPCVGFNDKWVAVTFNMFAVPGVAPVPAQGAKLIVFNKAELLAGGGITTNTFNVGFDGINGFALQPAVCLDANDADLYILDNSGYVGDPDNNTNLLRLSLLTGTPSAPLWSAVAGSSYPLDGFFAVQNRFSNSLVPGVQAGAATPLDAGDSRMCNVVQRNGSIWATLGGGWPADAPDRNAIFWYQLQPVLPNPIIQSGVVQSGGPGGGYMYPSISVNCGGDACIGFSSTSASISPSACYVVRLASDPAGTVSDTRYINVGRTKYVKLDTSVPPLNRWGDYSATVIDPLDDKTFWTLQEYSEFPVDGIDRFGVQWAQIRGVCPELGLAWLPDSQTVCVGQSVTFTIGCDNGREYQWNKDGVPIPGASNSTPLAGVTSSSYTIASVTHADAGQYNCTVTGLCGEVNCCPATLKIGVTFSQQPASAQLSPCDTAHFIVLATGKGTLQYQWYHNAVFPVYNDGRILGANTLELTINGVRYDDEGTYRCLVTDACGETIPSNDAQLTLPKPIWVQRVTDQPGTRRNTAIAYDANRGVTVLYGGSGDTPSGYFNDTWEWDGITWAQKSPPLNPDLRYGHSMGYDSHRKVVVLYGGRTANGGYESDLWEYDGQNWTLRSPTGAAGGPPAKLAPTSPIAYDSIRRKILMVRNVSPGVSTSLETWEFDPTNATWSLRVPSIDIHGGDGDVLGFDPVLGVAVHYYASEAPDGYKASHRWNGTTGTWTADPPITPNLLATTMAYDEKLRRLVIFGGDPGSALYQTDSFTCTLSGWEPLLPAGEPSSPPIHTSQPIAMAYDAHRRAMVAVLWPQAPSSPLETWEYRYVDRIVFDKQPQGQPLTPGATASFTVYAVGYGTLSYRWQHNDIDIADGPAPGGGTYAGATTATLTLNNVGGADLGRYRCVVSNACGSAASNAGVLGTVVPPDFDGDGDVDQEDVAAFEACASGPAMPLTPGCEGKDFDHDGDADQDDFAIVQRCYSGANIAGNPNCAD